MSSTPPLMIKLRLTQQPATDSNASSTSSATGSPKLEPEKRKRSRPNPGRRQVKPTSATAADTPTSTVDEDNASGSVAGDEGNTKPTVRTVQQVSQVRKEILQHKDTRVRKWECSPLVFHTLGGFPVKLPYSWQSTEAMAFKKDASEPTSIADIDQLLNTNEKDFRPFLCTQANCSKAFTSYDQLQTHETNMHGTKSLICGIDGCNKSFATSGQMTKHRKMVHFRKERKARKEAEAAAAAAADAAAAPAASVAASASETDNAANSATATPSAVADDMMDDQEESVDIGNSED